MKKITILLIIVIGIAIIGGWLVFSSQVDKFLFPEEIETPQENIQEEVKEEVISIIDYGEGLPQTLTSEFEEGMTAFDLLKNKTEELNISLKTKTYDMGIFIEAIGEKENGQDEKYWMYYVNEEMPMVAVNKYEIKPGDKVEFKFEKSPF